MKRSNMFRAALSALFVVSFASMAQAQSVRTFVASSGSDGNTATNCGRTAPCRNFAAAYSVTNAGGEILALDTAGFGALTINKAITVRASDGFGFIAVGASTTGITVNAGSTDVVIIRNIQISGNGAANTIGIAHTSGKLIVQDCGFSGLTTAVSIANSKADVVNSTLSGNTTAFLVDGTGTDTNAFPTVYGPTMLRVSGGDIVDNGTAFIMKDPGQRACPAGFTCPPSCTIGAPGCVNPDNKINIFMRLLGNSTADFSANITGNTSYLTGQGASCTNPDAVNTGAWCQSISAYSGSTNPR